MNVIIPHSAHQQNQLGSDAARIKLRQALAAYFHAQPVAAPRGFHGWPAPSLPSISNNGGRLPELAVGDPVVLMVSASLLESHAFL